MSLPAAYRVLFRVRDEMEAARFALGIALRDWHLHLAAAPAAAGRALTQGDLRRARDHLEITYILRLFGAWEAILRDYWVGAVRPTEPDLKVLINSLATRRPVDPTTLSTVHDLRDFRNEIVHENLQVLRYDFSQVARGLAKFLSYLPREW
jgi:hypothetical protein